MLKKLLEQVSGKSAAAGAADVKAPAAADFGSNAAAQEQLAGAKENPAGGKAAKGGKGGKGGKSEEAGATGRVVGLQATEGGTRATVRIGEVPRFTIFWSVVLDGGRRSHYLLDLVEPRAHHGKRTDWKYDGTHVTFVLPYTLDQVRGMGVEWAFLPGKHVVGPNAPGEDGKPKEHTGRLVHLQIGSDGTTIVGVHVRGGTALLGPDWSAILADGSIVSLREADVQFRGDIARFKVYMGRDAVESMAREVRFEPPAR